MLNDQGEEEIVTFVSRTLKTSEIRYFITEKEVLAIVWSIEKLRTYLRGAKKIIVRTDHEALVFLRTCNFTTSRLQRWKLALQDYNIYPEYIPGNKNQPADFLNRLNCPEMENESEIILASLLARKPDAQIIKKFKNLREIQQKDEFIRDVGAKLYSQDPTIIKKYVLDQDLICKVGLKRNRVILPESILRGFIIEIHEVYAHIGA